MNEVSQNIADGAVAPRLAEPHGQSCLEVIDLECQRGGRLLFRGLSFRVEGRELLQIEGANGSGKTSLLRLLTGLMRPSAGEIRWSGRNISKDLSLYHPHIDYLAHSLGCKEQLTPRENLEVCIGTAVSRVEIAPGEALARVGLQGFEDRPTRLLSVGQRRRTALARLMLSQARLWLLDEPLAGLDENGERMVEELLVQHIAGGGIAVITTHHPLSLDCNSNTLKLEE